MIAAKLVVNFLGFLLISCSAIASTTDFKNSKIETPFITPKKSPSGNISLNFQDISLRAVLNLLAEFSGMNIITSESVHGNITLHVDDLPWQQALTIILQSRGLGKRQIGNVLLIAPLNELAEQEKMQMQAEQQFSDLAPLQSELIAINYGKASDMVTSLKSQGVSLLSARGNVSVDGRTNTVWIQDTKTRLNEIKMLIKKLDVPLRQVLIEARIVNANSNFEHELGVRFGLSAAEHLSGSLDGANTLAQNGSVSSVPFNQRLNVDLPAVNVGKAGGAASFGMALAKLGKNILLDLELSAMENEGAGQIISSPRLITADKHTAIIEAGEEIPYQQETSSGATSVAFKKAVLSLNVTPQVTPDGKVILLLRVNQDKPSVRQVLGVPAVETRQIETQVLVDSGQTIVLGGIYEQTKNKAIQRVPFFGSLPIIGTLFRHTQNLDEKKELLIFVTPQVLSVTA